MYPANGALHNRASNDEGVQQIRKKPSMQIRLWVVFKTQKFTAKCLVNFLQPKFIYMYSHMSCLLWFGEFSHLGAGAWTKSTGIHQPTPALSATNSWPVFRAQVILLPITCKPPHYVLREVLTLVWEECLVKWTLKIVEVTCKSNYVENLRVHRAWSVPPQTSPKIQTCDGRTFRVPRQTYG